MTAVDWDARLQEALSFCQEHGYRPGSWRRVLESVEGDVKWVKRFSLFGTDEGSRERQLATWLKTVNERSPDHPVLQQIIAYPTKEELESRGQLLRILDFCQKHGLRPDHIDWEFCEEEPPVPPFFEGEREIKELWGSTDSHDSPELEALCQQILLFPDRIELSYREALRSVRTFCEKFGHKPHYHSVYGSERDLLDRLESIRTRRELEENRTSKWDRYVTPEFMRTIREFEAWYEQVPDQTPWDTHVMIEARIAEGLRPDIEPTKTSCGLYGRAYHSSAPKVSSLQPPGPSESGERAAKIRAALVVPSS